MSPGEGLSAKPGGCGVWKRAKSEEPGHGVWVKIALVAVSFIHSFSGSGVGVEAAFSPWVTGN